VHLAILWLHLQDIYIQVITKLARSAAIAVWQNCNKYPVSLWLICDYYHGRIRALVAMALRLAAASCDG
jgi:hypothetical protein